MGKNLPKNYTGIVEQLIRPTGLLDPRIEVRPTADEKKQALLKDLYKFSLSDLAQRLEKHACTNQIDDLINEIQATVKEGQRILVTTLTKRMAEDLTSYLLEIGMKVQYVHSEVDTVERVEILRDLRLGKYDVVVGINLLREGLDLPEVSLVAILDADKEGFLRSQTSLIQTIGRAARHKHGRVIMYADTVTDSMHKAIFETTRRRSIQEAYNTKHGIIPQSIKKAITDQLQRFETKEKKETLPDTFAKRIERYPILSPKEKKRLLKDLEVQMLVYSDMLEFEKAAEIRDMIEELKG